MFTSFKKIWTPQFSTVGALVDTIAIMGDSGVKLFFLLSGFLLFLPFARALLFDSSWPSLRRFYIRRVLRILPGYYVALFLIFLFMGPEVFQPANLHTLWMFVTLRNDFSNSYQMPVPIFWTLAIEFQFYLLLPIIAWLMHPIVQRGTLRRRMLKLTLCLLAILAWGMLTRYWGVMIANTSQLDSLLPHSIADTIKPYIYGKAGKYFDVFALGMLICITYVFAQHAPSAERLKTILRNLSPFLFICGLIELLGMGIWNYYVLYIHLTFHFLDPYQNFLVNYKDVFMPIGYGLGYGLCLLSVLHGPSELKQPFEWAPLRWVGLISYSLYIWHYPLMIYFIWDTLPKIQALGWSPILQYSIFVLWLLLTVVPISVTIYRRVEMPAVRLGEKLCQRLERQKEKPKLVAVEVNEVRAEVHA
jgi:peptidoglycan/LPS O-acetylase OafA/YrhL